MEKTHHSLTTGHSDDESDPDEQQNMEAVRDLLFGKKTREISEQINALEKRLGSSMEEFEQRLNRRVESLEQFVKGEIGSARERFDREQGQLEKRAAETGEKFRGLSEALDQRFSQLETHIGRIESDTRSQILDHSKEMAGEIEASIRRIRESVQNEMEALKQNSARRNELGEMLVELGMRITTESNGGQENNSEPGETHPESEEHHQDGLPA